MMTRYVRPALAAALAALLLTPSPAAAQQQDWSVDVVPLYLWATELDGQMQVRNQTVPIFLEFKDAADKLAGAFSFHVEATKGRFGVLTDLNFIRLSTDADFTVLNRPVNGDLDLDNTIFEAAGIWVASEKANFNLIGGIRTYSLSPKVSFSANAGSITPVDASATAVNAIVGFTYRPQLSQKLRLISRADIGAGEADLTWSAELGVGYHFTPLIGIVGGYKALGIDLRQDDKPVGRYDVTHYGPYFGLDFHWGR